MKVKAKHNIQYGDKWIAGGEVFEVSEKECKALQGSVEPVGYVSDVFPPEQPEKKSSRRTASKKKEQ